MQCGRAQEEPQRQGVFLQLTWTQREHVNKSFHYIISPFFLEGSSLFIPFPCQVFSPLTRAQPGNGWCCLIPHFLWHSLCILTLVIPWLVFNHHHEVDNFDLKWNILKSARCIAVKFATEVQADTFHLLSEIAEDSRFCTDIKRGTIIYIYIYIYHSSPRENKLPQKEQQRIDPSSRTGWHAEDAKYNSKITAWKLRTNSLQT